MRRFLTFHRDADVVGSYPDSSAEMLGGTIPVISLRAAAKFLESFTLPDGKMIFHITLSMPKGLMLLDDEWLQIVRHVLAESGLPPELVPWIAIGREPTSCDHIHIFGARCTFTGRLLEIRTSAAFTDALQLDLCHRLDLPEPQALQLTARRCSKEKTIPSTSFPVAMENAFNRFRPTTVRALDAALQTLSTRWGIATTEESEYLLVLDRQTGATRNPRSFGKRYSSRAILKRLTGIARQESLRLRRFFARVAAHVPIHFFDTPTKKEQTDDVSLGSRNPCPEDRRDPEGCENTPSVDAAAEYRGERPGFGVRGKNDRTLEGSARGSGFDTARAQAFAQQWPNGAAERLPTKRSKDPFGQARKRLAELTNHDRGAGGRAGYDRQTHESDGEAGSGNPQHLQPDTQLMFYSAVQLSLALAKAGMSARFRRHSEWLLEIVIHDQTPVLLDIYEREFLYSQDRGKLQDGLAEIIEVALEWHPDESHLASELGLEM